jgi:hypothetical protein
MMTFAIEVHVPDDTPQDLIETLIGVTEAQAELLAKAFEEEGAEVIETGVFDPMHPAESECFCVGPEGWHCPGEDSEHWADTDGVTCGFCGCGPGNEP